MIQFFRRNSTALIILALVISATGLFALSQQLTSQSSDISSRIQASLERQRLLALAYAYASGAEGGQRGYLLTGQSEYLLPYTTAKAEIWGTMEKLSRLYADTPGSAGERLQGVQLDMVDKFAEMESTLVLYDSGNVSEAVAMVRAGIGKNRMRNIRDSIFDMKEQERQFLRTLSTTWVRDRDESRQLYLIAYSINVGLILLSGYLIRVEKQTRARYAADLEDAVDRRTRELSQLSSYLQTVSERDRRRLARELHDELGGLLIAIKMDIAQLRRQLGDGASESARDIFSRMDAAIDEGVALKRRVIEQLRPSLLDNLGLQAALRWQYEEACKRSGLACTESIADDMEFDEGAAIHVFRIAQEGMTNILKHAQATSVDLSLSRDGEEVVLRLTDNGRGLSEEQVARTGSHGLAGMRHRAASLGGRLRFAGLPGGGTLVEVHLPVERVLRRPGNKSRDGEGSFLPPPSDVAGQSTS